MDSQLTPLTRAALRLPRHQITGAAPTATVLLLYAAAPRVFTELDALTRRGFDLGWEVVLDGHLPAVADDPPAPPWIGGDTAAPGGEYPWRRPGSFRRWPSRHAGPPPSGGADPPTMSRCWLTFGSVRGNGEAAANYSPCARCPLRGGTRRAAPGRGR